MKKVKRAADVIWLIIQESARASLPVKLAVF